MEIVEDKLSKGLLCDIESSDNFKDIKILKELLKGRISEADLDCISFFLFQTASEVFITNDFKKNTIPLFKMLYKNYIKKIIENLNDSEDRYDLVDYIIKTISSTSTRYSGESSDLLDIIIYYAFDVLKFNHSIAMNIDFKRLKTDSDYARSIEDIYILIEEYNYFIRANSDANVKLDRDYGMNRMYEYIELREKNDQNFYCNSVLMEYILLHSSEIYSEGDIIEDKLFEYLKKYVDQKTKQPNFNIFEEQGISDLLQIANSSRINIDQVRELSEIMMRNLKVDEIDREAAILSAEEMMKKRGLDKNEVERLFSDIQNIKLSSNGKIPNEFIEFIISEVFNEESELSKNISNYYNHICRLFESLGTNTIPEDIKSRKPYFYFIREFIDIGDPYGSQSGHIVYLNENLQSVFETLDTIFHENTHIEQEHHFDDENSCLYVEYMALKENILSLKVPSYQIDNYSTLFLEINAREKSAIKAIKFIMGSKILRERLDPEIIENLKKRYVKESAQYIGAFKKSIGDNKEEIDVNELFAMNLTPQLLRSHPILLLEYNTDCSVKSPEELVKEIEDTDNKHKKVLLAKILKNNGIFKTENIYNDAIFLINYSSQDEDTKKIMKHVIASAFMKILYYQYENFEKLDDEHKKQFVEIINRASEKMEKDPESIFSRSLLQIDKNGNQVMKTFSLIRRFIDIHEEQRNAVTVEEIEQ